MIALKEIKLKKGFNIKKIVYMGTPNYAKDILSSLIEDINYKVVLVITQPDRPVGRKKILTPPPVKELALLNNIEVFQSENLRDIKTKELISSKNPDFIVVAAFGQILPRNILDIAPCINLHASILPQYRGASPVQQSLLNSDKYTGVTAMLMEEGLDTGAVLGYIYFEIPLDMRLHGLMQQLTDDASILTIDILNRFDTIKPQEQINLNASNCKKIKKSDGEIDFDNAQEIYNKYRAYQGWPGIFTKSGMKLLDIELVDLDSLNNKAEILEITKDSIIVGCSIGKIKIKEVQPKSKKAMAISAYILGRGVKIGDYIT